MAPEKTLLDTSTSPVTAEIARNRNRGSGMIVWIFFSLGLSRNPDEETLINSSESPHQIER